eukprot:5631255-Pyramimonas_sp.AAC.1
MHGEVRAAEAPELRAVDARGEGAAARKQGLPRRRVNAARALFSAPCWSAGSNEWAERSRGSPRRASKRAAVASQRKVAARAARRSTTSTTPTSRNAKG